MGYIYKYIPHVFNHLNNLKLGPWNHPSLSQTWVIDLVSCLKAIISEPKFTKSIYTVVRSKYIYILTSLGRFQVKKIKTINGNIQKSIKIISWNKGNALAGNRINELKLIISREKPEVFFINEFNLNKDIDSNSLNIKNYHLELDNLYKTKGIARTAVYIKKI